MTVRRPPHRVGGALSCLGLAGLVGLAGCSAPSSEDSDAAPTTAGTTSATATTTPPPVFELPATCADLLTVAQVTDGLGVRLPGTTSYVVGEPQPDIGRTARATCGYGVAPATATAGASDPLLEVTVFVYTDAAAAAARVEVLVDNQEQQGVRADSATVPGADAVLLSGPADTTLVATVQERTYALTLLPGLLDPPTTQTALQTLAGDAIAAGLPEGVSGSAASGSAASGRATSSTGASAPTTAAGTPTG